MPVPQRDKNVVMPTAPAAPSGSTPLITKTNDQAYHRLFVVYSQPGAGKTHLIGTAHAAGKKVLHIDCDFGGGETLDQLPVDTTRLNTLEEWYGISEWLEAGNAEKYDVIAYDTGSTLQEMLASEAVKKLGAHEEFGNHYKVVRDMIVSHLQELKKRDVTLIVTAHEHVDYQGVGENWSQKTISEVRPEFVNSVWRGINRITSVIGRLTLVKAEGGGWTRRLDFQEKPIITAKDRSGRLPSRMDDPTWEKISQALEGTRASK
jgi:hypothetical protein